MPKMVIAATFRFEGDDLDLDTAMEFHRECISAAQLRGWSCHGTSVEYFDRSLVDEQ
jgi:hypothetical protein